LGGPIAPSPDTNIAPTAEDEGESSAWLEEKTTTKIDKMIQNIDQGIKELEELKKKQISLLTSL
jgi:hypothetical protein